MRKTYVVLVLLLFSVKLTFAQDEMFKSLFIYNFTKNIEWPGEYKTGNFIIGVLGNSPIVNELEKITKLKKVGNQTIEVKQLSDLSGLGKCHLLYITPSKSGMLQEAMAKSEGKPLVIVCDKPGMAKDGAGLNFVKVDGKQKFEINEAALKKNGLSFTSYLSTLGIVVN